MKISISKHVLRSINDVNIGEIDAAILSACIAIDATARKLFPNEKYNGLRFKNCLRKYYWIIEPMIGAGINLEETRFTNLTIKGNRDPDFADVIYHIFRCAHIHGDEISENYSLTSTTFRNLSHWQLLRGELHMPDRLLWALLGVSVFASVNRRETSAGTYYLSLGDDHFAISKWWGRENDFRKFTSKYNVTRVKLDRLDKLEALSGDLVPPDRTEIVIIQQPHAMKDEQ